MTLRAYIDSGKVKRFEELTPNVVWDDLTAEQQALITENPHKEFIWDAGVPVLAPEPEETLDEKKAKAIEEITAWERSLLVTLDSAVLGHPVYVHSSAISTLASALTGIESRLRRGVSTESDQVPVTVADQQADVMVTIADYLLLTDEIFEYVPMVRAVAGNYRQAVADASDESEFPATPYELPA